MNFYNEFDPSAAAWLRGLITEGLIPAGVVDERSIADIQPHELSPYTQCHFFAGIGGWSLALELAGVDPARPLWTGSCPCQPYSAAGKGLGDEDPRNLWPAFFRLIRECRPEIVLGEQVESAVGHGWLDGISADLEGEGYACGAAVLGAHSVLAPHIRQRLYWVANAGRAGHEGWAAGHESRRFADAQGIRTLGRLANSIRPGLQGHVGNGDDSDQPGRFDAHAAGSVAAGGAVGGMGDADSGRLDRNCERDSGPIRSELEAPRGADAGRSDPWGDSYWRLCRDGKHRRVPTEPALFPLADGLPYKLARRGSIRPALLKGAGNAIVPQVAAEFIQAYLETLRS